MNETAVFESLQQDLNYAWLWLYVFQSNIFRKTRFRINIGSKTEVSNHIISTARFATILVTKGLLSPLISKF